MNKITFSRVFGGVVILFGATVLISLLTDFRLFSPEGFIPRALCGDWTNGLIALHNFSDFFIWASYLTIPVILVSFADKKKQELPFPHLFWLFGLFIVACGTTHLIEIVIFYEPVYRIAGVVKLFTAAASVGTVFALIKVIPAALEMRSPDALHKEINERKKVEEQLRQREKQLSDAQKIANVGSWEWDIDNNTVYWSNELYRIFGLQPQEAKVTYESYMERVAPEDRPKTKEVIETLLKTNKPFDHFERVKRADGTIRILHSRGELIRGCDGKAVRMIGTCQDVTKGKKQEEELKKTKDELELRVVERTKELLKINKALQKEVIERKKANEKMKTALKEKDILLKEVHHRVKNNLQVISSLINLQSYQIKDEKVLNFYTQTRNRIKSMALVHEKLYMSNDLSSINFEEYLKDLVKNIYEAFKSETREVNIKIDVEKIFMSVDIAISLALIINELVSNSFKYAFPDDRKGELYVSLKKQENGKFILILRDNGVGFSRKIDFANTDTLGLRLVNILVTQLDGTISVNNSNGAEFIIEFQA
jgi:PAS domain S-box-containing protein